LSTLGDESSVPVKLCRSVFWLSLYAPPPTRCYNAGVKDVATRPVESPMDNAKLVELCRTKDGVEAALIQAALEDAGIRVRVEGDMLQGAMGGRLRMGWTTLPRIIVLDSDAERALAILNQLPGKAHDPGGRV
jgi:hypothetical protein